MSKKQKMRELREKQKELLKRFENEDRVLNPNRRKGRRSMSELFNEVDTKSEYV